MMLKYLIQTSIFRYSKNYGSLTHDTRIKDAVNMVDLICLLATVRTLTRVLRVHQLKWLLGHVNVNYFLQLFIMILRPIGFAVRGQIILHAMTK